MQSSKLGLQAVTALTMLSSKHWHQGPVPRMKLHRDLNITQKSGVASLAHRVRETWVKSSSLFAGPVEVDETGSSAARRRTSTPTRSYRAGRGGVGKAIVVGAKDRDTNRVSAAVVGEHGRQDATGFRRRARCQKIGSYRLYGRPRSDIMECRSMHETVKHSISEYVNGMAHTNGIESFWSLLKRGYHGTYRKRPVVTLPVL